MALGILVSFDILPISVNRQWCHLGVDCILLLLS